MVDDALEPHRPPRPPSEHVRADALGEGLSGWRAVAEAGWLDES